MATFRKKPGVVEAVQLDWSTWDEVCEFVGVGMLDEGKPEGCYVRADGTASDVPITGDLDEMGLAIPTLEGVMVARRYDWIIKGVKGEFYPCKPDIFEMIYEAFDQPISGAGWDPGFFEG